MHGCLLIVSQQPTQEAGEPQMTLQKSQTITMEMLLLAQAGGKGLKLPGTVMLPLKETQENPGAAAARALET